MISDSVPAPARTAAADKASFCAELFMMLLDGAERSYSHTQRLIDMYAVSCDLVQEDIVSL
jgi:hypothetical protein